jgi:AraC-like DNA-binding protein
MDPLSEVFSSMRMQRVVSTRLEATAPWGWRSSGADPNRVTFVLVLRGSGILSMKSEPKPVHLAGGDVFITFDGDPYTMTDDPKSQVVDCTYVERQRVGNVIQFGGGGTPTTFVSGSFSIDELQAKPILSVLPRFLHLRLEQSRSRAFQSILELLAMEVEQPGLASEATIARLYELLFVHAVRAYADTRTIPTTGWLAAISDKQLGHAAKAMHAHLEQDWSLQKLAELAAMSRSAFASKFKSIVGQSPLEYLTHWRMHRAMLLIRSGGNSLSEVAQAIGYESESAFNRVFKRYVGTTPAAFRRQKSSQTDAVPGAKHTDVTASAT